MKYISWSVSWWLLNVVIIIIVTSEASIDLFRPRLRVSSKVFRVVFVNSVHNSALFLAPCCCSFLLHVVANLICILLSFTSTGSTFVSFKIYSLLCGQTSVPRYFSEKFHLDWCKSFFIIFFLRVKISLRHKKWGRATALFTFILENFWIKDCLKALLKFPLFENILLVYVHFHRNVRNRNT